MSRTSGDDFKCARCGRDHSCLDVFALKCGSCHRQFHQSCYQACGGILPSGDSFADCPSCDVLRSITITNRFVSPSINRTISKTGGLRKRRRRRRHSSGFGPDSFPLLSVVNPSKIASTPSVDGPPQKRRRIDPKMVSTPAPFPRRQLDSSTTPARPTLSTEILNTLLLSMTPPGSLLKNSIVRSAFEDIPFGLDNELGRFVSGLGFSDSSPSSGVGATSASPTPLFDPNSSLGDIAFDEDDEEDCSTLSSSAPPTGILFISGHPGTGKTLLVSAGLRKCGVRRSLSFCEICDWAPERAPFVDEFSARGFFRWCKIWVERRRKEYTQRRLGGEGAGGGGAGGGGGGERSGLDLGGGSGTTTGSRSHPKPVRARGGGGRGRGRRKRRSATATKRKAPKKTLPVEAELDEWLGNKRNAFLKPRIIIIRNAFVSGLKLVDLKKIMQHVHSWGIKLIIEYSVLSREDERNMARVLSAITTDENGIRFTHIQLPQRYSASLIAEIISNKVERGQGIGLIQPKAIQVLARTAYFRCVPIRDVLLLLRNLTMERFSSLVDDPAPVSVADVMKEVRIRYPPISDRIQGLDKIDKLILLALLRLFQDSGVELEKFRCTGPQLLDRFELIRKQTTIQLPIGVDRLPVRRFRERLDFLDSVKRFFRVQVMSRGGESISDLAVDPKATNRELTKFEREIAALELI